MERCEHIMQLNNVEAETEWDAFDVYGVIEFEEWQCEKCGLIEFSKVEEVEDDETLELQEW